MKFKSVYLIALLSICFYSCVDDLSNLGSQIQPASDRILVDTASFNITSANYFPDSIVSRPDSMMLGRYYDMTYGTTNADIFTQLQPPLAFNYPANSVGDSAKVIMYFNRYFGDSNSPMEVNIYKMNKGKTFNFTSPYYSNINPDSYVDKNNKVKIGSKIFSPLTGSSLGAVEFKLTTDFVSDFSKVLTKQYTESEFQNFLNGMYITTDFGSASMVYVLGINMKYYFHYTYNNGKDTVRGNMSYPANQEVRQVNRFNHPDKDRIRTALNSNNEVNFISAPANSFTKVTLPLKKMKSRMNVGNKILLINRAVLKVDVSDVSDSSLAMPLIKDILMIKESAYLEFFSKRSLPSAESAIVGSLAYTYNKDKKDYDFYYNFDLAKIITTEITNKNMDENINFILVPITQKKDGSGYTTSYNQQNTMGAVKICSGNNKTKPMKIEMIYSGF